MKNEVNNSVYHCLGCKWYEAFDDPVALLRAESRVTSGWILNKIFSVKDKENANNLKVLDIGCGAGFLTNKLSKNGFDVTGLDISVESLEIAKLYDETKKVKYVNGDAYELPFADASFDIITSIDFLEHVEFPQDVIKEMSRVLKPKGLFFLHTFNRNFLSWLVIIKFVEWFVPNTPKNLHILRLFIKPKELRRFCLENGMPIIDIVGTRANIFKLNVLTGIFKRKIPDDFSFSLSKNTLFAYLTFGIKN